MQLLKHAGIYLFGRALPAGIGVGAVALYTRLLDPASVGAYALLLSTSLLASGVAYTWLRVAALRLAVAGGERMEPDLARTVTLLFAGTSLAVAALEGMGLMLFFHPRAAPTSVVLAVFATVASAWYELSGTMLQARLSVVAWGLLNFARSGAALGASLCLIALGWRTDALLAGFVTGNCATLLFCSLWAPALRGRFDPALARRLVRFGWPSSISAALGLLSPAVQRYVLLATAGAAAVGLYAVAQDFASQTMLVLIGSVSLAGIPLAFKARDSGAPDATRRQLHDNAALIVAVALPATVGLVALAGPVAHVFLGPQFRAGAELVIALIAVSTLLAGVRMYYFDQAFQLAHETAPQATIAGVGTAVVIVASFALVPRWGATGAAVASLAASTAALALSAAWGRRVHHMPLPLRSWSKTAAASAGMLLAMVTLRELDGVAHLLVAAAVGALVYVLLSALSRPTAMRTELGARLGWLAR